MFWHALILMIMNRCKIQINKVHNGIAIMLYWWSHNVYVACTLDQITLSIFPPILMQILTSMETLNLNHSSSGTGQPAPLVYIWISACPYWLRELYSHKSCRVWWRYDFDISKQNYISVHKRISPLPSPAVLQIPAI